MITGATQDGNMISGTWIHKKTNLKIVVRDMFFENENMIILTTDGQQIYGDDFSLNYLLVSSLNEDAAEIEKNISSTDPLFEGMEDFSEPVSTKNMIDRPRVTESKPAGHPILDKLFKDKEVKCKATLSLTVPSEALKMARDFLEVSENEMVEYIVSRIEIDKDDLKKQIQKYIS